jgi:hypothetical protein
LGIRTPDLAALYEFDKKAKRVLGMHADGLSIGSLPATWA